MPLVATAQRLHETVSAVCPVTGVKVNGGTGSYVPSPSATAQQLTDADAALAAFDFSDSATLTWQNLKDRTSASALVDAAGTDSKITRAIAAVLVDEINLLRLRDRDRADDVAAATNLADLKTRWAARTTLSDRTLAQAKQAVKDKINAGAAD